MIEKSERLTLAELRRRAGLTQRQIAEILDVTVTTVSSWERGTQVPRLTFAQVEKLMNALDCSIHDLVEATGQQKN